MSPLTFYRDEFFCFVDPWADTLTYKNCCEQRGPQYECWPPSATGTNGSTLGSTGQQLSLNKCCWDVPVYSSSVDCESAELSYCLGKLGLGSILAGDTAYQDGQVLRSNSSTSAELVGHTGPG